MPETQLLPPVSRTLAVLVLAIVAGALGAVIVPIVARSLMGSKNIGIGVDVNAISAVLLGIPLGYLGGSIFAMVICHRAGWFYDTLIVATLSVGLPVLLGALFFILGIH